MLRAFFLDMFLLHPFMYVILFLFFIPLYVHEMEPNDIPH